MMPASPSRPGPEGLEIDDGQVMADLHALRRIGGCGSGVERTAFSAPDMEAREWLRDRFAEAGLDASIDGVGNVHGRSRASGPAILLGSHSDTVPRGGWLDGVLGVAYALEAVRAWRRAGAPGPIGLDVVSFADEEGTFAPLLGSRAFTGALDASELEQARDAAGRTAADALAEAGVGARPVVRFDPARHFAFLEAHIEQGPLLEARGIDIGIVGEIVGLRRHWVGFTGRADHAGTTPMGMRRDAGHALFDFAGRLDQVFRETAGPDGVWNLGVVEVRPGAGNIVPAVARVLVEFRDRSPETLARMGRALIGLVETMRANAAIPVTITAAGDLPVTMMDQAMAGLIDGAARSLGASTLRMASGAGHDAMVLARHVPAAMLFVPSIGGRSHDVAEDTHEHDIRRGARVYGAAVARILQAMARAQGAPEAGAPAQPSGKR